MNTVTSVPRLTSGDERVIVGRYELVAQLARGGIATVYLGRLISDGGLQRTVAIKRLHAQFRTDGDISLMFLDEARVALRVKHPNVVHAVDVVLHDGELFIVMEYVEGVSLSQLLRSVGRKNESVPLGIASSIIIDVLHGLHAAHEAKDELGEPLHIIHRDVSPQNVLVGADGIARVLDFGIAKTINQAHVTRTNEVKGKISYMAPEQIMSKSLTRSVDIFSMGIVAWELLTGHKLFFGDNDVAILKTVLEAEIPPPSTLNPAIPQSIDKIILKALERDPEARYETAEQMAIDLEGVLPPSPGRQVGQWVRATVPEALRERTELLARVEGQSGTVSKEELLSAIAQGTPPGISTPMVIPVRSNRRTWVFGVGILIAVVLIGVQVARSGAPHQGAAKPTDPQPSETAVGIEGARSVPAPAAVPSTEPTEETIELSSTPPSTSSTKGTKPKPGTFTQRPKPRPSTTSSASLYTRD